MKAGLYTRPVYEITSAIISHSLSSHIFHMLYCPYSAVWPSIIFNVFCDYLQFFCLTSAICCFPVNSAGCLFCFLLLLMTVFPAGKRRSFKINQKERHCKIAGCQNINKISFHFFTPFVKLYHFIFVMSMMVIYLLGDLGLNTSAIIYPTARAAPIPAAAASRGPAITSTKPSSAPFSAPLARL